MSALRERALMAVALAFAFGYLFGRFAFGGDVDHGTWFDIAAALVAVGAAEVADRLVFRRRAREPEGHVCRLPHRAKGARPEWWHCPECGQPWGLGAASDLPPYVCACRGMDERPGCAHGEERKP